MVPHNPPGLVPEEPTPEFGQSEHPIGEAVLAEPIEHRAGRVAVPCGPGLGTEIDCATIVKEPSSHRSDA